MDVRQKLVAAVVAVGGLAFGAGGGVGLSSGASASPAPAATYKANRLASGKEAGHLLSLRRLPAAARRGALPSSAGVAPPALPERPAASSLFDVHQLWTVPWPAARTTSWLRAHHPAGLTLAGWGSGTAGYTLTFSAPATAQWALAELEVSIVPVGTDRSYLRLDGVVVPLDPRPLPDDAAGPRARVTLLGGCPSSAAGYVGVSNPGPALGTTLLPPSTPTGALVCLYRGAGQFQPGVASPPAVAPQAAVPRSLTGQAHLGPAAAGRLAAKVAAVPLAHVDGAVMSCPLDTGTVAIVAFAYPSGRDVDIWAQLGGCGEVANGFIKAVPGLPAQAIEALVPGVR